MKTSIKLLGLTATIAVLAAPATAETVLTQVGEKVTYTATDNPAPDADIVGYEIKPDQKFARLDRDKDGIISRKEFQNGTMLDNELEIYYLFDTDKDGGITPEEYSNNSRYGNAKITNKTTNKTRKSNANFGSLRDKYTTTNKYVVEETASGTIDKTIIETIEPSVNKAKKTYKATSNYN